MGRLTASGIPGQNQTFAFDMLGRLTSAVSPIGGVNKTVAYQWDLAGRNTRVTYPTEGGVSLYVAYDYLVTGEMTELRENSASVGVNVLAKYSYDNLGRRTALARAGGTAMTTSYSYFANDTRLQTLAHDLAGTTDDLTLTFGWTPASQLSSRTASNDAYSWTSHYNEDLLATLNGLNQVTAFGAAITYDNRGNLTADGVNTYSYDPQNRLTAATTPTGAASLKYDALGRLHEVAKGQTVVRFLYSGSEIIAEYNGAGALQTRYVRGQGPDEVLVEYQGGGPLSTKRWLIADERGSVIGAANSSGVSQWKNAYDEYGRPAPGNQGRFQYTGQLWLFELNLYHYKARAYSPNLGRFLQTDPIGYADGLNLYAYVGGDPVNRVDPLGLERDEIVVRATRTNYNLISAADLRLLLTSGTDCGRTDQVDCSYLDYLAEAPAESDAECAASQSLGLFSSAAAAAVTQRTGTAAAAAGRLFAVGRAFSVVGAVYSVMFGPTADDNDSPNQFVVRAGMATPQNLQRGVGPVDAPYTNLQGFSVVSAPGLTVEQLARAGQFPNRTISVTTVNKLHNIGIQVAPTIFADRGSRGAVHATVLTPNPLPDALAAAISSQFTNIPNPVCAK